MAPSKSFQWDQIAYLEWPKAKLHDEVYSKGHISQRTVSKAIGTWSWRKQIHKKLMWFWELHWVFTIEKKISGSSTYPGRMKKLLSPQESFFSTATFVCGQRGYCKKEGTAEGRATGLEHWTKSPTQGAEPGKNQRCPQCPGWWASQACPVEFHNCYGPGTAGRLPCFLFWIGVFIVVILSPLFHFTSYIWTQATCPLSS